MVNVRPRLNGISGFVLTTVFLLGAVMLIPEIVNYFLPSPVMEVVTLAIITLLVFATLTDTEE